MTAVRFPWVKGHGTRNDFVLLPDHDGALHGPLDAQLVRRLCDRRSGIGADGVIRVIRTEALQLAMGVEAESSELGLPQLEPGADGWAEWFMDYRNADGSVAEMCGNGIRVLARYLWEAGLTRQGLNSDRSLPIATRGGVRFVRAVSAIRTPDGGRTLDGGSTVEMGVPTLVERPVAAHVRVGPRHWPCQAVLIPNPHAVVFVDDLDEAGTLLSPPVVDPPGAFPNGANVEFVVRRGEHHVALRVYERGVGETPSCGTGVAAAAWVSLRNESAPPGTVCTVDVPGGQLTVEQREDEVLLLTGPAVLGPRGELDPHWLG